MGVGIGFEGGGTLYGGRTSVLRGGDTLYWDGNWF